MPIVARAATQCNQFCSAKTSGRIRNRRIARLARKKTVAAVCTDKAAAATVSSKGSGSNSAD
ncbi:MAG TPA: hypothetical protein VFE24_09805 [Pirellulales bacterium]|jgi:hypothetical protein|nr:hypothetical protein [Pirellulales bacterium]